MATHAKQPATTTATTGSAATNTGATTSTATTTGGATGTSAKGTTTAATTAKAPAPVATLSSNDVHWLLVLLVLGMVFAGFFVSLSRRAQPPDATGQSGSVIRSWLAITLVLSLVLICGAAFALPDTSVRSTLFGGLIASVGSAVAFYFSAKTAEQAQASAMAAAGVAQGTQPTIFSHMNAPTPARVNHAYRYKFGTDGKPTPTYGLTGGHLPPGLALEPDGTLHGKPTAAGTYTFSLTATNPAGSFTSPTLTIEVT